eukprot:TRINITY_DN12800_c0_g1_i3.p1 TRINITY_DN12800_c0_g1~~TRINITY_DN12800_c0_g1_i3.p1  ORF type:complete len:523 (-),score=105.60 TRINITY_DN12800_c0_g1_i3:305-1873(-)
MYYYGLAEADVGAGKNSAEKPKKSVRLVEPGPDRDAVHVPIHHGRKTKSFGKVDSGQKEREDDEGRAFYRRTNTADSAGSLFGPTASGIERSQMKTRNAILGGDKFEEADLEAAAGESRFDRTCSPKMQLCSDMMISTCILANGISMGMQADYMAMRLTDASPDVYMILEIVFLFVFATELFVRLAIHKRSFYTMPTWRWNVFDTFVVACQFTDIFLSATQIGFVRLLRVFRLLRILRLIRLLHFFGDMNVVAQAIFSSLKFLLGAALLLFLLMYMFGIVFVQIVTLHRIDSEMEADEELTYWWGSLPRSMLSLGEAILGGCDWDGIIVPLLEVSPALGFLFLAYIAFAVLAVMNVITGIVVDSAICQADRMKDQEFTQHLTKLYSDMVDISDQQRVSREAFLESMTQPAVLEYIEDLGVDVCDAATLFDLLDRDDTGHVASRSLVQGMVRLRAGAKFLDIMALLSQLESGIFSLHEAIESPSKQSQVRVTMRRVTGLERKTTTESLEDQSRVSQRQPCRGR